MVRYDRVGYVPVRFAQVRSGGVWLGEVRLGLDTMLITNNNMKLSASFKFRKGDLIPKSFIEGFTGVLASEPGYNLAMLSVRDAVCNALASDGYHVTIVCRGDDLAILSDEQASSYLTNRGKIAVNSLHRAYNKLIKVDTANIPVEQKPLHSRRVEVLSRLNQSVCQTVKEIRDSNLKQHKRELPAFTSRVRELV